jgi:hypothetical protein
MSLLRRRNPGSVARVGGAVALMLLLAACATGPKYGPDSPVTTLVVPVERLAYPPLLPKLDLTAGIHYPDSFRSAVALAGGGDTPRYRYELGAAAVALFDQHAAAMFARTVELPSIPGPAGTVVGVDVVLVPRFEPHATGLTLGVDVLAPDGASVARSETVVTTSAAPDDPAAPTDATAASTAAAPAGGTALSQGSARDVAISLVATAAGDVATTLVLSPELARWADARGLAWQWPGSPVGDGPAAPPTGVTLMVCTGLRACTANEGTVAVGEALRRLDPSIAVVAVEDLRRAVYPWTGRVLLTDAQVAEWLRRPAVAARAGAAGVRYLAIAESLQTWKEDHGLMLYGPGFLGLAWETTHESALLRVFDLAAAVDAGDVKHQREDVTFLMPAYLIPLPIPIPRSGPAMAEVVAKQLLPLVRPAR